LRSSSRKSPLRAGSRDGAKQLCGLRLSRQLPRERTATMSQAASQKPLRAARRLIKAASSTPSQGDGLRQATHRGNRDPQQSGRLLEIRIGSVSAWLGVRAAQAGDGSTLSHIFIYSRSAARGPIQSNGVGHSTHRAEGNQRDRVSHSLLACSCVRPGVPQFGKQLPAPGRLFSCAGSGAESSRSRSLHTHQRIKMYS
jgi:hypothetical protein